MSSTCKGLCLAIIHQHYGPVVADVAQELFKKKSLPLAKIATHLDRDKVGQILAYLSSQHRYSFTRFN